MKIYFAAPLHGPYEQCLNTTMVTQLRNAGHTVYLPQEHGVWEKILEQESMEHPEDTQEQLTDRVKKAIFIGDMQAIQTCDCIIACATHKDNSPSEGMIWEMGYAIGLGKPVYLCNYGNWDYNLMLIYGSTKVFPDVHRCIAYLKEQAYA